MDPGGSGTTTLVPISDYPMYDPWIEKQPEDYVLHFQSVVERSRVSQIDLPTSLANTTEMRKFLQAQGFMLRDKNAGDFFVSWIQQLQKAKDTITSEPFGWCDRGKGTEGFIYAAQLWGPKGAAPAATADGVIARQYTPTGSDQYWRDAVKLVTSQGRPDLDVIVASAFAAPLVKFTGHNGMVLSTYSKESGIGKSTALTIAQAVWGDPIKGVSKLSDTKNQVMNKVGGVRSLPIYWDELKTEEDTKKFVQMAFELSGGKEKARLTQQAKQKEAGSWQTMVISASNESILDIVIQSTPTSLAGLYRVFEYKVTPVPKTHPGLIDAAKAQIILAKLNHNFGGIGLEYAKFLGANHAQIEKDVEAWAIYITKEMQASQDERFWVALVATILCGARYANQLGFTQIDEKALKDFMVKSFDAMRHHGASQPVDMSRTVNVSSILSDFLSEMRANHTLITNRIHQGQGKPPKPPNPNAIQVLNDATKLAGIHVHYGQDDKLMRISQTMFGAWLKKQGKSRHIIMDAFKEKVSMRVVIGRLGSGTVFAMPTSNLLEIDLNSTPEIDFIDEK